MKLVENLIYKLSSVLNIHEDYTNSYTFLTICCGFVVSWFYLLYAEIERKWFPSSMHAKRFWRGKITVKQKQYVQRSNARIQHKLFLY